MCFYSDADWYSQVCEQTDHKAERPTRCMECRRTIAIGAQVYHIYMQQYEVCPVCDEDPCLCEDKEETPGYGETYDYDRCQDCDTFLECVQAAELEAGCDHSSSQPALEEMLNSIQDGGPDEAKKYFKTALKWHPELKANGYLGWLWRRMFVRNQ